MVIGMKPLSLSFMFYGRVEHLQCPTASMNGAEATLGMYVSRHVLISRDWPTGGYPRMARGIFSTSSNWRRGILAHQIRF